MDKYSEYSSKKRRERVRRRKVIRKKKKKKAEKFPRKGKRHSEFQIR